MATARDVRWSFNMLCVLGYFLVFTGYTYSKKVVLLDTTTTSEVELGWTTYPSASGARGWVEASYAEETNNIPIRIYTVCQVTKSDVNNWLRTPFIPREEANRLYIEIRFTMRRCVKHSNPRQLQQCKETFNLYYYEAESDFANDQMPTWDEKTYTKLDTIAADYLFVDTSSGNNQVNHEVIGIPITRRGVYFAIQDNGACMAVISIRVYYITCPQVTKNFAHFLETPSGPSEVSIRRIHGACVDNAAEEKQPVAVCNTLGEWKILIGGCKCMPGYYPDESSQTCLHCNTGFYKWHSGNVPCQRCPAHSYSGHRRSVECECDVGYYRKSTDPKSLPCTQPPSEPRLLKFAQQKHDMVELTWKRPSFLGGRLDLSYKVRCHICESSIRCHACDESIKYYPANFGFNATSIKLTGLRPSTQYRVIVYAENGVTSISNDESPAEVTFTTDAIIPAEVRNIYVISSDSTAITLGWEQPRGSYDSIIDYEIRYYPRSQKSNSTSLISTMQNMTISNLLLQTEYGFEIRGRTTKGWGNYSKTIYARTTGVSKMKSLPIGIITGAIVAVILCMAIAIIMVLILLRRNRHSCGEKAVSDCDALQYTNGEVMNCPPLEIPQCHSGLMVPLFQPPGALKTYVDPHTYEDPNQAVREFTREINSSNITIESVLGGGEFGDVCKGRLRLTGRPDMQVAIKTLKPGATDKSRLDFLTEASIMGQFDDPNVIFLEGVVTKSEHRDQGNLGNPIMIVTEFMANGSQDTFLRNNDGKFTVMQLVGMMRGIASGMRYLADMGYVHRDLAARNILVNETLVCKVADFGLSRELETNNTDGAYTTKGGKIPVRWTAPEAISFRKFTTASDVWSYGVVMWEIMAYGERPYWNWSNQDVIRAVDRGYRLPPPMDCPEAIHLLTLDCWQKERAHRPKFMAIVKTLDKLIRAPEMLRKVAKPRPHNLIDPNVPDLTQFNSIEDWLITIKMERYIDSFLHAGYTNMEQVSRITIKELVNLGVMLVGHQKKLMNSVQTLRAQLYGAHTMSEGYLV